MDPVLIAVLAGVPGLIAGVVASVLVFRSSNRATDVNQQAANLAWVKELRQDASDARNEVEQLRAQVRDLRRQLDLTQREADHWIAEHQAMRRQAWRPGMTIDRLRELLGPIEPGTAAANGH